MNKNQLFCKIPKVDLLLEQKEIRKLTEQYGREIVKESVRDEIELLRVAIRESEDAEEIDRRIQEFPEYVRKHVETVSTPDMCCVINGTGTILHTNLGRAPISREHATRLTDILTGYSNLEYDLREGKRGERYSHFEELLCKLTGAEAAMAVNNNAAAVMLILSSMAKGGEVIVSRGELVEIGGKFRIPSVMEQSGVTLVEVGTTNKTHDSDYEEAITEETKALMKVHTSNYRIVGFTESVSIENLVPIARGHGIPVIEDLGSGVFIDLSRYGLSYERTVQDSVRGGVDVVCFSGDKLLGGPQAGIIVGKKKYIDMMKKNQLTRALRIDKFTASALELVLMEYLSEEKAVEKIPVLRMIRESREEAADRAESLKRLLEKTGIRAELKLEECESQLGGGALPLDRISSMAVSIRPHGISVANLEEEMRHLAVPIIGRIANDKIYLDVRTIESRWFGKIAEMLGELLQ